jgi:hypothetical protein
LKRSRRHDSPSHSRNPVRQSRSPADKKKREAEVPAAKHIKEAPIEEKETEVPSPKGIKETLVERKMETKAPVVNDTHEATIEEKTN